MLGRAHPFFVEGRGWVELGQVGVGSEIVTRAGPNLVVKSLSRSQHPAGVSVYNFEVQSTHSYFVGTARGGAWVHNNCNRFFHYTDELGHRGILGSNQLRASLRAVNPKDARYGDGQYLTDIVPGTKTPGQLSYAFLRVPWAGKRFTHFIEIDTAGLNVIKGRENVYVIPNSGPLDVAGRIISSGKVP